jgi:hypothetical protein
MPSETYLVAVDASTYTDVSLGQPVCAAFLSSGQRVRLVVSATQPVPDVPAFIPRVGPPSRQAYEASTAVIFAVADLDPTTRLWVRAEAEAQDVIVVRGDARPVL